MGVVNWALPPPWEQGARSAGTRPRAPGGAAKHSEPLGLPLWWQAGFLCCAGEGRQPHREIFLVLESLRAIRLPHGCSSWAGLAVGT